MVCCATCVVSDARWAAGWNHRQAAGRQAQMWPGLWVKRFVPAWHGGHCSCHRPHQARWRVQVATLSVWNGFHAPAICRRALHPRRCLLCQLGGWMWEGSTGRGQRLIVFLCLQAGSGGRPCAWAAAMPQFGGGTRAGAAPLCGTRLAGALSLHAHPWQMLFCETDTVKLGGCRIQFQGPLAM